MTRYEVHLEKVMEIEAEDELSARIIAALAENLGRKKADESPKGKTKAISPAMVREVRLKHPDEACGTGRNEG